MLLHLCFFIPLLWTTAATAEGLTRYRLNNGMQIMVQPDHRAPVVVSQLWYRVGSSYEPLGQTGISHVLEHMMFNGSRRYGKGEISRLVARHGGVDNAFTSYDYTVYYQRIARQHLPLVLALEADRMRHLAMSEQDFIREREVVQEERRQRIDDRPSSRLFEGFMATAFSQHPYRQPIIGWQDDLASLTRTQLQHWYQQWYAPNNAFLIVVGDVIPQEVFTLAQRHFGAYRAHRIQRSQRLSEPPQKEPRNLSLRLPETRVEQILQGYKVPVLGRSKKPFEPYALEVLTALLNWRLEESLQRKNPVAAATGVSYSSFSRLNQLLTIRATPTAGTSLDTLATAIENVLQEMRQGRISSTELTQIKTGLKAQNVFSQDSLSYRAMELGMAATSAIGLPVLDQFTAAIMAIDITQVQQVAQRYLRHSGRTEARLLLLDSL